MSLFFRATFQPSHNKEGRWSKEVWSVLTQAHKALYWSGEWTIQGLERMNFSLVDGVLLLESRKIDNAVYHPRIVDTHSFMSAVYGVSLVGQRRTEISNLSCKFGAYIMDLKNFESPHWGASFPFCIHLSHW